MPPRTARWVLTLRQAVKQDHGFGWNLREISGKVQLTRRFDDGTRSSVVLDLPWSSESTTDVLGLIKEIRARMENQQLGLKDAYQLIRQPASRQSNRVDWHQIVSRFEKYKTSDTGEVKESTYLRMYRPVINQVLEILSSKPSPRDAKHLLSELRDRFGGKPGSRGRQLRILYASQLLRYGVKELGISDRWLPPSDLLPFVGKGSAVESLGAATPLKDAQLLMLLDDIADDRWQFAIKLMACFGLRPVELRYIRPSGNKLHVSFRKRTARGTTSPLDVPGLDPIGLEGESQRLIDLLSSKEISLPPLGPLDGTVAQSVRQYLDRRKVWADLKNEVAGVGGRLSAYSFRHGFALRAHQTYGLTPRIAAAIMRHSLQTHVRHYGHWTDAQTIDEAIASARLDAAA